MYSHANNFIELTGDTTKKAFDVTSKSFRALGAASSSSWSKLKGLKTPGNGLKGAKKGD